MKKKKKKVFGRKALKSIAPCIVEKKKKTHLKVHVVGLKEKEEKERKYIVTKRKEKRKIRRRRGRRNSFVVSLIA